MSSVEEKVRGLENPWDDRAIELIDMMRYDSRRLHLIASRYAKWEYKADHNRVARPIFKGYRLFIAYGVGGGLEDSLASQIELVTGIDKKHSQRVNAVVANTDQVLAVVGGYEAIDLVGEAPFYTTLAVAGVNAVWNSYRLLEKGKKAKPAIGYVSAVAHGFVYAQRSIKGVIDIFPGLASEAKTKAQQSGVDTWYAAANILLEGARDSLREAAVSYGKVLTSAISLKEFWNR